VKVEVDNKIVELVNIDLDTLRQFDGWFVEKETGDSKPRIIGVWKNNRLEEVILENIDLDELEEARII